MYVLVFSLSMISLHEAEKKIENKIQSIACVSIVVLTQIGIIGLSDKYKKFYLK